MSVLDTLIRYTLNTYISIQRNNYPTVSVLDTLIYTQVTFIIIFNDLFTYLFVVQVENPGS